MLKIPSSYRLPMIFSIIGHVSLFLACLIEWPAHEFSGGQSMPAVVETMIINSPISSSPIQENPKPEKIFEKTPIEKTPIEKTPIEKPQKEIQPQKLQQQEPLKQSLKQSLKQPRLSEKRAQKKVQQKLHNPALVAKQQELQKKLMAQQMLQENHNIQRMQSAEMHALLDQYRAKILDAIRQQWIVPHDVDKNLSCVLLIHLAPTGSVLDVTVFKSSGDALLDRSARMAVLKASPLPIPKESALSHQFRELRLTVKPLHIAQSDNI